MATAYKCDRCDKFFEKKPVNSSGLFVFKKNASVPQDICENCLSEFVRFWFEPRNTHKKETS